MGIRVAQMVIDMTEKIGFLFPGQGAQTVGMGKDFYDAFPAAKSVYDRADEILGYSVSKICFDGPESELTRTVYAQPAIFVTSAAILAVLREKFSLLKPSFSAGLSLGEFTALVASGAISFEDGLKLVRKRAEAMEKACQDHPGTMASILGMSLEDCQSVAQDAGCQVANLNSPEQIVLSGTHESIQRACSLAEERGAKRAIPLKVGGAFHSALMADAKTSLEGALLTVPISEPVCVFVPNVLGNSRISDPREIRRLLALQLTQSVKWTDTMRFAAESNIKYFIEIGPGTVLKGLAKKCGGGDFEVHSCGKMTDIEKLSAGLMPLIS